MNFNSVAFWAVISALIINYGINKKPSLFGFLLWFGIAFIIVGIIFIIFNILSA